MIYLFKILPLLFLSLFQEDGLGQDYKIIKQISNKGNLITVDDLGNIFLVNNEQLAKFDPNGNLIATYSDLYNGDITLVDAGDPFKILLYYRDFSQIVFLDNFLSKTTDPVNLETLGLELSTLACSSYNNGFWVYLPQSFEIIRIGQDMIISHRSGDISKMIKNEINPNYIIEKNNMVYLNDPDYGIMIFDRYGSYYKIIPLKGLDYFQVEGNNIISLSGNNLRIYNLKSYEESYSTLPEKDPICINIKYSFNPKRLFLLNKNGINIYSIALEE
jgi:hypothetical protein